MPSAETAAVPARDFVGIAKAYARAATAKKNRRYFGVWIRLAAQRFLDDLKRAEAPDAPFYFDEWAACDPCDFAEKFPHVEGRWFNPDGTPQPTIVLHPAQIFFLVQLFGFRTQDGGRRFTTALFAVARKNAKSTLAAIIALYCLTCEGEVGPQVVTAATTGAQARVVYKYAKAMVDKTADFRAEFNVAAFVNAITSFESGGTIKPINAKASTQDGLNPSCTILDELHAHKNADLMSVLRSAAGARMQALFLYLTTEGYASPGPWEEEREYAKRVLRGVIEPTKCDHYLALYFAIDEHDEDLGTTADDIFDETAWQKANPLLDSNPLLLTEIRKLAAEARDKPSTLAEFKIKRCNRPASVARGWINLTKWRECRGDVDMEALRSVPCWGGLDLSATTDLTSFRVVWDLGAGRLATKGWRYVPRAAVRRRTTRGLIPYAGWVEAGLLIESGDEAIDYAAIEAQIVALRGQLNLQAVHYDTWNASQTAQRLQTAEVPMVPFIQGFKSYHPAMQALEIAYLSRSLVGAADPILTWNASNVVARYDPNLSTAPDKRRSVEKIDDICALLMAIGGTIAQRAPQREYQMMFV